jgi:hypothetical protein
MPGVSRPRWFVVKFLLVGVASSLIAGGLSLMIAWWANPVDIFQPEPIRSVELRHLGRRSVGYALFAFALGVTLGLVFRKTLPAMAVTLAGFVAVRFVVTYWVRAHFEAPIHGNEALNSGSGNTKPCDPSQSC